MPAPASSSATASWLYEGELAEGNKELDSQTAMLPARIRHDILGDGRASAQKGDELLVTFDDPSLGKESDWIASSKDA